MDTNDIEISFGQRAALVRALYVHLHERAKPAVDGWEAGFDGPAPGVDALAPLSETQRARVALMLAPGAALHSAMMQSWRPVLEEARRGWGEPWPFDFLRVRYTDGRAVWYSRLSADVDLAVALGGADGGHQVLERHRKTLPQWRQTHQWVWGEPGAIPAELTALLRAHGVAANPAHMALVRYMARGVPQISEISAKMLQAANVVNAVHDPQRRQHLARLIAQTLGYALREDAPQAALQL